MFQWMVFAFLFCTVACTCIDKRNGRLSCYNERNYDFKFGYVTDLYLYDSILTLNDAELYFRSLKNVHVYGAFVEVTCFELVGYYKLYGCDSETTTFNMETTEMETTSATDTTKTKPFTTVTAPTTTGHIGPDNSKQSNAKTVVIIVVTLVAVAGTMAVLVMVFVYYKGRNAEVQATHNPNPDDQPQRPIFSIDVDSDELDLDTDIEMDSFHDDEQEDNISEREENVYENVPSTSQPPVRRSERVRQMMQQN